MEGTESKSQSVSAHVNLYFPSSCYLIRECAKTSSAHMALTPKRSKIMFHGCTINKHKFTWMTVFVLLFSTIMSKIKADCECGYSYLINGTSYVFTDLLESDFLHLANISLDTDWTRQGFNVTPAVSRGPYGESLQISQVISNPLLNNFSFSGLSQLGGDAGLQLYVSGGIPSDGLVPVAEVNSVREDMLWGSYRAAMKLTLVPGTCGAFFWVSISSRNFLDYFSFQLIPLNLSVYNVVFQRQPRNRHGVSLFGVRR
jgi:hypothetical protein